MAESEAFAPRLQERMNAAERLLALERDILQARADLVKIDGAREALTPWLNLPVPQTFRGTARFSAWVGSVQGEHTASELLGKMEEAVPPWPGPCGNRPPSQGDDQLLCAGPEAGRQGRGGGAERFGLRAAPKPLLPGARRNPGAAGAAEGGAPGPDGRGHGGGPAA